MPQPLPIPLTLPPKRTHPFPTLAPPQGHLSPRNPRCLPGPGWFRVGPERRCMKMEAHPNLSHPRLVPKTPVLTAVGSLRTLTSLPGGPGGPDGPSGPGSPWKQEGPKSYSHPALPGLLCPLLQSLLLPCPPCPLGCLLRSGMAPVLGFPERPIAEWAQQKGFLSQT